MSSLSVDTDTNICGAFIVRQCGKQFCIQYLIWFSQLLSNIHATIVPHFVEQETEARWGEVTSPKSPSWASSWARIPARSEQPWDQYPVFSMEAFWTTPSERIADLLDNLDNHDLQDNLPFTTSLLGLFLCSPLRSFSTQISDLQPHSPHTACEWLGDESYCLIFMPFAVPPWTLETQLPTTRTLPCSLGRVTWLNQRGPACQGRPFAKALWSFLLISFSSLGSTLGFTVVRDKCPPPLRPVHLHPMGSAGSSQGTGHHPRPEDFTESIQNSLQI